MDAQRWVKIGAIAAIIGGTTWLLKVLVLVLAGGVEGPLDLALFYVGALLLLIGATGLGLWLVRPRSRATQVVTVIVSIVALLVGFVASTMLTEAIFGAGTLAGGEGGIVLVALLGLCGGGLASRRPSRTAPATGVAKGSRV